MDDVQILFDVGPSKTQSASPDGRRRSICALSLRQVNPSSAGYQRVVNVWAEDGDGKQLAIGMLSSEEPLLVVYPRLTISCTSLLRHDAEAATVRFYGCVLDPPPSSSVAGYRVATAVDDGVDEASPWRELDPYTEEEEAELYDSDNSYEYDEDGESRPRKGGGECSKKNDSTSLMAAPPVTVVPDGKFLGPARFAAVKNTAGFIRLAASDEEAATDRKEVVVLYRYTRFSRTWSGRRGVEVCRRTKLHHLRFVVPPAGDMASALAWAGAALVPLIYPAVFSQWLHQLWTTTVPPLVDDVPPQATRVQVVVDAGILRRGDDSEERMEHMRAALEAQTQEAWPEHYHVFLEKIHLPEPVRREEDEEEQGYGDTRAGKRRKVVVDECSVCLEPLERGLAAWPGCRHMFHGECVEMTIARCDMCPLCRNRLCPLPHSLERQD